MPAGKAAAPPVARALRTLPPSLQLHRHLPLMTMPGNTHRSPSARGWLAPLAIGILLIGVAACMFVLATGRGHRAATRLAALLRSGSQVQVEERIIERDVPREIPRDVVREVIREVPVPADSPNGAAGGYDLRKLYNGIQLKTTVDKRDGRAASAERTNSDSYSVDITLRLNAPKPITTLAGLDAVHPGLSSLLPGLSVMLPTAKVSDIHSTLYDNKEQRIRRDLFELNKLLSRHNYYDCETVLELQHPGSTRKLLLIQAEMDVVSDGSDGDRLAVMPQEIVDSTYYQPTTSYGWPKRGTTPNPLIAGYEKRLKAAKDEYAIKGLSAERNRQLKAVIDQCQLVLGDLKRRSFLIAEYDPFIVLPTFVLTDKRDSSPKVRVGDYAVVLHQGKAYPAIVGDAGPDFKIGEASLRIGREIDQRTNSYRRPVSDLNVTYLVFPASAEAEKGPPDLALWHQRCDTLLKEIGGLGSGATLNAWVDILKQRAEEEAKRKAEEEAKRKAEEDAKRKAEEEALRKAAEPSSPQPPNSPSSTTPVTPPPAVPAPGAAGPAAQGSGV